MKQLSNVIGSEIWLKVDYAICKFMQRNWAFKTDQNPNMIFTMKPVLEEKVGKQLHIHLRFHGKDQLYPIEEDLDIDVYVPLDEVKKIVAATEEWQQAGQQPDPKIAQSRVPAIKHSSLYQRLTTREPQDKRRLSDF